MAIRRWRRASRTPATTTFYCIGTGIDWNTKNKTRLGYKNTTDDVVKVASEFGLGEKTGIELCQTTTPLACQGTRLMSGMKSALWSHLYYSSTKYWPNSTYNDEEKLRAEIGTVAGLDRGESVQRWRSSPARQGAERL